MSSGSVKAVQQVEVGEQVHILQAVGVLLEHLHGPRRIGRENALDWRPFHMPERRMHHADRPVSDRF